MQIVVFPLSNPDGFKHSAVHERFWRKNRMSTTNGACAGVDLNRNFRKGWGLHDGSSEMTSDPCSETYRGPSVMSEPETKIIANELDSATPNVHIDVHSFGQLLLRPWSFTSDIISPLNDDLVWNNLEVLGHAVQKALNEKHGKGYTYGGNELLYPAPGVAADHIVEAGGFGLTLELRPSGYGLDAFAPSPEEILPCAEETWEGLLAAI